MPKEKTIKNKATMTILAAKYFGMVIEPMAEAVEHDWHHTVPRLTPERTRPVSAESVRADQALQHHGFDTQWGSP
jgi:hypothetical protein